MIFLRRIGEVKNATSPFVIRSKANSLNNRQTRTDNDSRCATAALFIKYDNQAGLTRHCGDVRIPPA